MICEKHMIYNTRLSDERIYIQEIGSEACSCEKKSRTHIFQYNSLHFILDGEGTFNGQPVKKGDCFYVRAQNLAIYEVNPQNPWQYFWINFSGSLCEDALDQIGLTSGSGIFHLSDIEKIRAIFKDAFSKHHQNADVHFYMDSYFFRLVGAIASEFEKTNAKPSPLSLSESRFRQALVFIGNNYTHPHHRCRCREQLTGGAANLEPDFSKIFRPFPANLHFGISDGKGKKSFADNHLFHYSDCLFRRL